VTTNIPSPTYALDGLSVPSEAAILSGVFADIQAAFGGSLNPSVATPQGQLSTSLSSIIAACNDLLLFYTAQVDPAFASGRFQDAIARIYFLSRLGSLPTAVACVCTGAVGTIIPQGSLVASTDGTVYQSEDAATIGSGGTVTVQFSSINDGPKPCPVGSITFIQTSIPGWDAVTNPADGTPGRSTETRAELEQRRQQSVALNSISIVQSIRGTVLNVDDVIDAYVTENPGASAATIGGVSISAHSIYVAAVGGSDADVARAIWTKKPPGCNYVGNTTIAIEDTGSGYQSPYPTYDVTFERPTALPIFFDVELADGSDVPADAATQVRNAIVAAFNGQDGGARAGIGATIYASRYNAPVANSGSWVRIKSLKIGTTTPGALDLLPVNIDQNPTLDPAHITVNVT
jgi:uncharacterized phage protein gp47/JayE